MERNKKLQGLIYGQYDSAASCAKALGWDRRKLHKFISGKAVPTLADASALAKCLNTSMEQMIQIFLE